MDLSSAVWRKSSRSSGNGGNCVEAARLPEGVAVRDSKNPGGPALLLAPATWRRFIVRLKHDLICAGPPADSPGTRTTA
ncbi:DUF397 domain-containing protein [Actinomadura sp. HBU206391]|uniref:DUF397 domain-containing protein n=1 Tax=Actinomadura sp. HBU206391 TaxID=2731692 RepID=UPI00164FFA98|nr:DUF397 domain-containing protein [Actinomadura sp. HBU206391]MBC6460844.1 DUF397 domain-containing protein [Actinomadura sp. HBU206391]